jgi:PAS domain S-box-containing protein
MMLCDPVTGRILDVNRAVIDRLGHSREKVLSMGLRDVHPAKDQGKISQVIGPTLSEPARSHSMALVGIDGREFAVEAAFSIVPFAGSTVLQAFYHDVTGYQKAQTALRDAEELAHIGRMASAVAHEIRNPLSAIVSGIRLLTSSERSEPERVLIFETILSESERLDNTLNDFLQFARPRSPRRRPVDVGRMAGDILGIVWSDSGVVGDIVVKLDIPENLPPVSCDGDQIRQVFWNVILNAVQAMAGKGELIVRLKPSTSALMIIVSDSGPGISFEELERVFEPFHTTKPRGTGLGLPIARRIIQGHGGTITIESVPGKGTTVTFSLPLDRVDGQA